MSKNDLLLADIKRQGMLPLFYNAGLDDCKRIVHSLYEAGIRVIEFTNRGGNAIFNFRKLVECRNKEWPGLVFAAGTIKDNKDAKTFSKAGADIIICPGVVKSVGKKLTEEGVIWIPGCTTPTEILQAIDLGAPMIKIFPGSLLGPRYIYAIREIFPDTDFMVTGGVEATRESMDSWFRAGVAAVGLGSQLVRKEWVENHEFRKISALAKDMIQIICTIKSPS